jgi:glycosyltransferase involved in cell wall biosynthesis
MKIGIAGPIDMTLLYDLFPQGEAIPGTFSFPLIAHLARALRAQGHEITVFALSDQVTTTSCIRGDGITAYICPLRRVRARVLDFSRKERHSLRDAMRNSGCDVIHAHWTYEFGAAAIESGLPHVVTAHDVFTQVLRFARHPYMLVYPFLALPVLRGARCMTAVSPYAARSLRWFVRSRMEIVVIPNGIEQKLFERSVTERMRPSDSSFTFATIGQGWSGRKNAAKLVEAFGILRKEFGEQVRLLLFGVSFEPGGEGNQWSVRRGLTDGVEFIGRQPHETIMDRLVHDVDVLVHPALEETFGMAVAEAMALGLPVIGGRDSGGVPWLLEYGKAGLLVDVSSAQAIADGMRTMLLEPETRNPLAHSARERASTEFQIADVARKYETVLIDALQEQRSDR